MLRTEGGGDAVLSRGIAFGRRVYGPGHCGPWHLVHEDYEFAKARGKKGWPCPVHRWSFACSDPVGRKPPDEVVHPLRKAIVGRRCKRCSNYFARLIAAWGDADTPVRVVIPLSSLIKGGIAR